MSEITISSGVISSGMVIGNNEVVNVYGSALNFTIMTSGLMKVFSGGLASSSFISGGGSAQFSSGASLKNVYIYANALINGFAVNTNNYMESSLILSNASVAGGAAVVYDNQSVMNVVVSSGAILTVDSGGTASALQVYSGAVLNLLDQSVTSNLSLQSGVVVNGFLLQSNNNTDADFISASINDDGSIYNSQTIISANIGTNGFVSVSSGGKLVSAANSGMIHIFNGGIASAGVNSNIIYVSSGGLLDNVENLSQITVGSGGTAGNVHLSGGSLVLNNYGSAFNTVLSSGAFIIQSNAVAFNTTILSGTVTVPNTAVMSGVFLSSGMIDLHSGRIEDLHIYADTVVNVSSGGSVNGADIHGNGHLNASSASLQNLNVLSGGSVALAGSAAASVVTGLSISNGGWVSAAGSNVFSGTTVFSGAWLNGFTAQSTNEIASTLTHSNVVVSSGTIAHLFDSESADNVAVKNEAVLNIGSGDKASAANLILSSGAILNVDSAAWITLGGGNVINGTAQIAETGKIILNDKTEIADGGKIQLNRNVEQILPPTYSQAELQFDFVSTTLAPNEAMLNNIAKVEVNDTGVTPGSEFANEHPVFEFRYTDELYDAYVIAKGAAAFDAPFQIVEADGISILVDRIDVDSSKIASGVEFTLAKSDDTLYMTIYKEDTVNDAAIYVTPYSTDYINADYRFTASFSQNALVKQYSKDGGDWTDYNLLDGVVFDKNGTLTFRSQSANGVEVLEPTITVDWIDKKGPSLTATHDTTPTLGSVTVTVAGEDIDGTPFGYATSGFDNDSISYSLDGTEWLKYNTTGVVMVENGTIYFRGKDFAGNQTTISHTVNNIISDVKTPVLFSVSPEPPEMAKSVTIVMIFDSNSPENQYKLGDGIWNAMPSNSVLVTEPGWIYFRSKYGEDIYSGEFAYEVTNIDNIPPEIPVVTPDTTEITDSVVLTATYHEVESAKEYSFDGTNWKNYTEPVTVLANMDVYFRETDTVGNSSQLTYTVDNIAIATAPGVTPSTTELTTENVLLTVSKVSGYGYPLTYQYQFQDGEGTVIQDWTDFDYASEKITVESNRNVYVRAVSDAGYSSYVTLYSVTNIDSYDPVIDPLIYSRTASDGNLTVNVTASDDLPAGVNLLEYTLDGITWNVLEIEPVSDYSVSSSFTVDSDLLVQPVFFKIRATDQAGRVSESPDYWINSDVKASTVTWTNSDVTVDFSAYTAPSAVTAAAYSFDGGSSWNDLVITDDITPGWKVGSIVLEENQDITFKTFDADNNAYVYEVYSCTWIDKDPAVITVTGWEKWSNEPITVEVTATDNSGIAEAAYTFNGGAWTSFVMNEENGVYSGSFTIDEFGPFLVRVTDLAGNITYSQVNNIRYDDVAPEINSVTWNTDWTNAPENAITVNVTASDALSGVAKMYYTFNGTPWTEFEDGSFTLNANGPFMVKVVDNAGNETLSQVYNIKTIDRLDPVIVSVEWNKAWTNEPITVSVTVNDEEDAENKASGIAKTEYTFSSSPWTEFTGTFTAIYKGRHNGPFMIRVTDNAGNVTVSKTYNILNYDDINPSVDSISWDKNWTRDPVLVTVTASDDFSGVASLEYSLNGGVSWADYAEPIAIEANTKILVRVTDNAGNESLREDEIANIDTTAPIIDSIDWDKESTPYPVTVTVITSDNLSGVAATAYSFNGGDWKEFTDTFQVYKNGTFQVKVVDHAGNEMISDEQTVDNIEETDPPVIDAVEYDSTTWTNGNVTVTVTAEDEFSGIGKMYYTFNSSPWTEFEFQTEDDISVGSFDLNANGPFMVKVVDKAGNETLSSVSNIKTIDRLDPVIDLVEWNKDWTNEPITVSVTAHDEADAENKASGIAKTEYTFASSPWTEFTGTFTAEYNGHHNGSFLIRVTDNAGNVTISQNYNILRYDDIAPTINSVTWNTDWTNAPENAITVNVTAEDDFSGIGKMYYTFNGTPWTEFENGSFTLNANGPFMVKVVDNAGNETLSQVYNIKTIDRLTPVIDAVSYSGEWTQDNVTVTVTAHDEADAANKASGIGKMYYTFNGTPWTEFDGSFELDGNGPFMVKVVDNAGNETLSQVYNIKTIDRLDPVIDSVEWNKAWTNEPITVSVTAHDEADAENKASGIAKTEYTFASSPWTEFTGSFTAEYNGRHNGPFLIRVTDNAGNVTISQHYNIMSYDCIAPWIKTVDWDHTWTKDPVTVTVASEDDFSGVALTEYSFEGGDWIVFTDTFEVTENGTFQIRVTDNAGNEFISDDYEVTNIEPVGPVVSVDWNTAWTQGNVTVNVTAEAASGIDKMYYMFDGSEWMDFEFQIEDDDAVGSFDLESNGTFMVKVVDKVGYETLSPDYYIDNIDRLAPVIESVDWNKDWTNQPITVSVAAEDPSDELYSASGIAKTEFTLAGSPWTEFTGSFTAEYNGRHNGPFMIRVTDNADNVRVSKTFNIQNFDNIAPWIESAEWDGLDWTKDPVTVTVVSDDDFSGVALTEYSFEGGDWIAFTDTFDVTDSGIFQIRVTDNAGNVGISDVYEVTNIDNIDPEIIDVSWNTQWTTHPVMVTVISDDYQSGVALTEYSFNGGAWNEFTDTFEVTENGIFEVRVTDNVGNTTVEAYEVKNIDPSGPEIVSVTWTPTEPTTGFVTVTVNAEDESGVSGLYYTVVDSLIWTKFSNQSTGQFYLTGNCTFVVKAVDDMGFETISQPYTVDNIIKAQSNSAALTGEELESWSDASMLLGSAIDEAVPVSLDDESAFGSLIGELQSWISPVEEYSAADADLKKFGNSSAIYGLLAV